MLPLPQEIMARIASLQWLNAEQIKSQFEDVLPDCKGCQRAELLRSIVIYRLQERFYGLSHSPKVQEILNKAVEGERLMHAPADDLHHGKKLVRNWKGRNYEVLLMSDNTCEFKGKKYKSLTAVAKAITGTHWNGPVFFGVKK